MIVAGFGFRDGAHVDSLRNALELQAIAPDCLATAAAKADAAPFAGLARALGLPVVAVQVDTLRQQPVQTHSAASHTHYDTGSVAEAAALAAAGPGARLLAARVISHDRLATCAIAIGDAT
ncbi:cobalt-precorrin 5A hydrolase [Pseudosulfitobacter pseudonitzschiae]|uniref:Precorrin methylase n=1 Tax=Pseudosulfitobacter pseudonitzschiae TaxID=1402135 RepID=A0A073JC16_9RHOB|nr:cobalamin biosynthesis protein [Pseudosulfitobacter pseudonitzschiae]KEJ95277.1 precorrin methylase [Pseudosulfitobacter pseudonitzschiae]QKS11520.1 cobalamin biosynthesis protein [Pseudosulfitobacter pseudonitzschiae]SHF92051.1 cobalt-precorrin 5A hydrolase [Pseudosulfitobacter pseudonitzschiae]